MRQQPVIPEICTERAKDVKPHHRENDAGPTEEPWNECKERKEMDDDNRRCVSPLNSRATTFYRDVRIKRIADYRHADCRLVVHTNPQHEKAYQLK